MLQAVPCQGYSESPSYKRRIILYAQMQVRSWRPGYRRREPRPHSIRRLSQPLALPINHPTPCLVECSPTFLWQFIQHISRDIRQTCRIIIQPWWAKQRVWCRFETEIVNAKIAGIYWFEFRQCKLFAADGMTIYAVGDGFYVSVLVGTFPTSVCRLNYAGILNDIGMNVVDTRQGLFANTSEHAVETAGTC